MGRRLSKRSWAAGIVAVLVGGTFLGVTVPDPAHAAAPPPTATTSVITVRVGSDRLSDARRSVTSLAGVQLGLYDAAEDATPVPGFGTCTSDVDGECWFIVPDTQVGGANRDRRFWVKQISSPAGYDVLDQFQLTGAARPAPYRFQTGPALIAGREYISGIDFMTSEFRSDDPLDSSGTWQAPRDDPAPPQPRCDLRLAMIFDVSGDAGAALEDEKDAAGVILRSFRMQGTQTGATASVFTFSDTAPAARNDNHLDVPIGTPGSRLETYIDDLSADTGTSNWDVGIAQLLPVAADYDVVLVLTGNGPTSAAPGARGVVRFMTLEDAIFSANAIKATGTRMLAWDVADPTQFVPNVRAISGPELGRDYTVGVDTTASKTFVQGLTTLARDTCRKPVTIHKLLIPAGGTIGDATPGQGFPFDATTTGTAQTTPSSGTGSDGNAPFDVRYQNTRSGTATFTERQLPGYTLVPVGGANAACIETDTGARVTAPNSGALGFTIDIDSQTPVVCTVYNQAPPPSSVTVTKTWIVNGTAYPDGKQPAGLTGAATIDGTPQPFGVARDGIQPGILVSLDETTDFSALPLCTLSSARLTDLNGSPVDYVLPRILVVPLGSSSYGITNTVTCTSELTLSKSVANGHGGSAQPDDWRLTATPVSPPPGVVPVSVLGGNTAASPVAPGVAYVLSEAGTAGYTAGAWDCKTAGGATVVLTGGSTLTPALGTSITCTITNTDQQALLTLRKVVVAGDSGSSRTPAEWGLTAAPTDGGNAVGGNGLDGVTAYPLDAGTYTLTEAGPPGFEPGPWVCPGVAVSGDQVVLASGANVTCTITNTAIAPTLTLRKTVDNGATGASAVDTDWSLTAVNGESTISGRSGTPAVTGVTAVVGTYVLSESGGPDGYTASQWTCTGVKGQTGTTVTLAEGESAVCAVTNTAVSPVLTLRAAVTGGEAAPSEWTLVASTAAAAPAGLVAAAAVGDPVISGPSGSPAVTDVAVPVGSYALSVEGGPAGYVIGGWTCAGATTTDGSVTLALADDAVCTVAIVAQAPTPPPTPPPPAPPSGHPAAGGHSLPGTGADPVTPVTWAIALLTIGGLLVAIDRRRRRST